MTDQALSTQPSVCLQCKSLWREIVSRPKLDTLSLEEQSFRDDRTFSLPGHHQTLIELRNSAWAGCLFCSLLWQAAAVKTLRGTENLLKASYSLDVEHSHDLKYTLIAVTAPKELHEAAFRFVKLSPGPLPDFYATNASWTNRRGNRLHSRVPSTASNSCFNMARMWLTNCVTMHASCSQAEQMRKQQRGRFTPQRLLRLYTEGTQTCVQLLSNAKAMESTPVYMTLSHCWGQKKPLMLNKHNVSFLEGAIQLEQLPRTYADAVVITMRMGCQNLWIDSLCIAQDSTEDWELAVQEMGDIYRFSFCNIAAQDAADGTEGCFATRIPHVVHYCEAEVDGRTMHAIFDDDWLSEDDRSPLDKRAWVFQEKMLAPRTISYTSAGLTWECLEGHDHETEPGFMLDNVLDFKKALHLRQGLEADVATGEGCEYPMSITDHHVQFPLTGRVWHAILGRYTASELTFTADRWPAISGVAQALQSLTGCTLLAGMWRETMLHDLTWSAARRGNRYDNMVPSWSWLSIDSPVHIRSPGVGHKMIYSIKSLPEFPEDHMHAGFRLPLMPLVLSGHLRRVTAGKGADAPFLVSCPIIEFGTFRIEACYDCEETPPSMIWALLQLHRDVEGSERRSRGPIYFGMLIVPASGQEGCWNRIGSFYAFYDPDFGESYTPRLFGPVTDVVVV